MQQRADMNYKYLFFTIIFLLSISLNSQIMPSSYGFFGGPDKSFSISSTLNLNASNSSSYSGSGTTWTSTGNANYNTTLVNGVTYVNNGNFDYMSFDGSNDYVETSKIPSQLEFYNSDYTFEAAVRFKDIDGDNFIFGTASEGNSRTLHLGARDSKVYQGHYAMDGSSDSGTLSANVWYHIIWTYDVSASEMKMYLDGTLIKTETGKTSFLGTNSLRIGFAMSDRYANIDLAYVRSYGSILSTSEISSLYSDYQSVKNGGTSNYVATTTSLIQDSLFLNVDASNSISYTGSETTWTDLTGSGYDGTLINGPSYDSNESGSIQTDGSNDYVLFGPLPYVGTSSSNLTWELWVNPSDTDGNIMSMSNTNPQGSWNMPPIAASGSKFIAKMWNNNILYADNTYSQGTWYHVVLTWDYNNNTQSLYVNGVLNDSESGINYSASNGNNYIFLGDDNPGANNTGMFGGKYGEFRIYNKSLSSSEVQSNYNSTKSRYGL